MNPPTKIALLLSLTLVGAETPARDLTWTGAADSSWNTVSQNWLDGGGAACAYANGDSVTVGDSATQTLTLRCEAAPGGVLFNLMGSLTLGFEGTSRFLNGTKSFVKDGAGALTISATGDKQAFRDWSGEVLVNGGSLILSGANWYMSFGGNLAAPKTFVVGADATLQVTHRNCFGKCDAYNGCGSSVWVKKGGTFQLGPDGGNHTGNTVRDLTLEGGSVVFAGVGLGAKVGTLTVLGTMTVTGDVAQIVTDTSASGNNRVGMAWQKDADGKATGAARTVFDVADVTGDDLPDLTFEKPLTRGNNVNYIAGFVKKGAGRMKLAYNGDGGGPNSDYYGRQIGPNGDVDVLGGVLEYAGNWTFPVPNDVVQRIYVGTNATLHISNPNALGPDSLTTGKPRPLTKFHIDHGTLLIDCPDFGSGHIYLGDEIVLDDATFKTTLNGVADGNFALGALSIGSLLHFKGTVPARFMPFEGMTNNRLALLDESPTEIRVEDVTGDEQVDATIGFKICDRRTVVPGKTTTLTSGFVKTGKGTLLISPTTQGLTVFSGDTEIREGTVRLDKEDYDYHWFGMGDHSFMGDVKNTTLNADRKIVVSTNGVLEFCQRNMLDSYTYGETGGNDITAEFVLRGGKIRFTGDNPANSFGDITVDGGSFEYGELKESQWGAFNFRGTFRVIGDRPLTLPPCKCPRLTLYPSYACVYDIADVTGDGEPDLVSHQSPSKPVDKSYYNGTHLDADGNPEVFTYGFAKRGAGKMVLNKAIGDGTDFDAEARVEAGDLVFNDDFSQSGGTAVVSAGAGIGGTGAIANATLAEGAVLVAEVGQLEPLKVHGDVRLPASGTVRLHLPKGATPPAKLTSRVLQVVGDGKLSGAENLRNWKLEVEGEGVDPSQFYLVSSANGVRAGQNIGMMLLLR